MPSKPGSQMQPSYRSNEVSIKFSQDFENAINWKTWLPSLFKKQKFVLFVIIAEVIGIDYTILPWVCNDCHKSLSKTCPDKEINGLFYELNVENITEEIEPALVDNFQDNTFHIPQPSSEHILLDFAAISDER
ncbi:hypothetical protein BpHYR1_031394 [Brachionus plicatilis]|uniref:Uncharacterized protein n=1 Tax=Brachionus plicatilis TaxID=10195 RepID=A0A3M7RVN0_BRAPC|nr:hypothetical protein BpHYR1_031394 [Brachionus plicatilis]